MVRYSLFAVLLAFGTIAYADDKLEGKWTVISMESGGKIQDRYKGAIREHKGDQILMTLKDGSTLEATMKVDAEKKTIDINPKSGLFKDKTLLAIYDIKGDTLRICFADPDKDRPKTFNGKTGATLFTLKKAK